MQILAALQFISRITTLGIDYAPSFNESDTKRGGICGDASNDTSPDDEADRNDESDQNNVPTRTSLMAGTASKPRDTITLRQAMTRPPNWPLHFDPMRKKFMHLIDNVSWMLTKRPIARKVPSILRAC